MRNFIATLQDEIPAPRTILQIFKWIIKLQIIVNDEAIASQSSGPQIALQGV